MASMGVTKLCPGIYLQQRLAQGYRQEQVVQFISEFGDEDIIGAAIRHVDQVECAWAGVKVGGELIGACGIDVAV